jgi:NAD(P)-dependent dehydrogenase (short-subunit alcohol dehydrogenase family)
VNDSSPTATSDAPVTLITGAGGGMGRSIAILLADRGHRLALLGRTHGKLDAVARELRARHPQIDLEVLVADLSDPGEVGAVMPRVVARFGRIDNLVNGAGIAPLAPIAKTDLALLERCFSTNTFAPALLIAAAWPIMSRQRNGCIVNISTIGTSDPFPGFFVYAASKSALDSLTRSISNEGRRAGIRGFTINPGAVETPLLRSNFPEKVIPPERALPPERIAEVVVDCIEGRRDDESGRTIPMPSP